MWMIPLILTALVILGNIAFLFFAEGEDVMMAPVFLYVGLLIILGAWGIYGLWYFVVWLL